MKAGIKIVNGWPAMSRARVVTTVDELEHLKLSSSIGDAAMWHVKHEWLKPGITERQMEAKVHDFMLSRGCEISYDSIVASGGNIRDTASPGVSSKPRYIMKLITNIIGIRKSSLLMK